MTKPNDDPKPGTLWEIIEACRAEINVIAGKLGVQPVPDVRNSMYDALLAQFNGLEAINRALKDGD